VASFLSNLRHSFDKGRYPQLLIIGAQKAGTTTLFNMLNRIPGFCASNEKETGFFIKDKFYQQGSEWYLEQFRRCSRAAIKYEATPAYTYYPDAPRRIHEFKGDMKFIVILREPSDRCYSAWNMFRRFNESGADLIYAQFTQHANPPEKKAIRSLLFAEHFPSFKQAVIDDIERYISQSNDIEPSFARRGIYCEQIANYLQYFSLDDFLFLEQRELNYPAAVLQKVSEFLSVEIDLRLASNPAVSNLGDYLSCDAETEETLELLRDFYKPHNEKLFSQIGVYYDWNERFGLR
jgi:hypothetical protein